MIMMIMIILMVDNRDDNHSDGDDDNNADTDDTDNIWLDVEDEDS